MPIDLSTFTPDYISSDTISNTYKNRLRALLQQYVDLEATQLAPGADPIDQSDRVTRLENSITDLKTYIDTNFPPPATP